MRTLRIDHLWDGRAAAASEAVRLDLTVGDDVWSISFEAPFHGDPVPPHPPGRCDGLWEYEVVELFLVGAGQRYVELEFGPAGHYLALRLDGIRNIVDAHVAIEYEVERQADRWTGRACVPAACLPEPVRCWNAFAIHGTGNDRRYLAAGAVPGEQPDFHRIDSYPEF